ncbi:hypothetical protein, partial [Bacillus sp. SA1-12]|uniref:hypothetical protein n=1 Tax=Bacillus sp. SA1-12 TaxID=1455638 RepID=UPI000AD4B955
SKPRGQKELTNTAVPKSTPLQETVSRDDLLSVDLYLTGEDRCLTGRNGQKHRKGSRGTGSSI